VIADAVRTFAAKLSGTTPRERAGLAMLAAIAALTAAVYAADWAGQSARAAATATQTASDSEALRSVFADDTQRRRLAVASGDVWRASRRADAFATEEILTEIELLCMQSGFGDPRVALVQSTPSRGQVGAVDVSVTTDFDWRAFLSLLEALEGAELSISVRSIDVSEVEGAQSLALVVSVPVINAGEGP
jgi:hypothetical protein